MDEAAHAGTERGGRDVAHTVDVRGSDSPIGIAGDRDQRREVVHDVDALECALQRVGVADVGGDELHIEAGECDARLAVDGSYRSSVVEERAHEVGAHVTRGTGDGRDHVQVTASYRRS